MNKDRYDQAIEIAAGYLATAGLEVQDRGWSTTAGRLDLVARRGRVFVVCVVKTRTRNRYGRSQEAISRTELTRLRKLGVAWLSAHGARYDQVRVDVIALTWDGPGGYTLEHFADAGER